MFVHPVPTSSLRDTRLPRSTYAAFRFEHWAAGSNHCRIPQAVSKSYPCHSTNESCRNESATSSEVFKWSCHARKRREGPVAKRRSRRSIWKKGQVPDQLDELYAVKRIDPKRHEWSTAKGNTWHWWGWSDRKRDACRRNGSFSAKYGWGLRAYWSLGNTIACGTIIHFVFIFWFSHFCNRLFTSYHKQREIAESRFLLDWRNLTCTERNGVPEQKQRYT